MNRVSVTKAIETGTWYECKWKHYDEEFHFRLRILGFNPTTVAEIDVSLIDKVKIEGILWLISIEVVNLNKQPFRPDVIPDSLMLMDEDGYQFEAFIANNLSFDEESGLLRFSVWPGSPSLSPKIKAIGKIGRAHV